MGEEISPGGSRIYRHGPRAESFEFALGDSENIERIGAHIQKWVGPVETVYHELTSDVVHVDIHHVKPGPGRPFHTLITSGMSDRPMHPPEELAECRFAELVALLPPTAPSPLVGEGAVRSWSPDGSTYGHAALFSRPSGTTWSWGGPLTQD